MRVFFISVLFASLWAGEWTPEVAAGQKGELTKQMLSEWRQMAISGQKGYFTAQNALFLSPRQYTLGHGDGEVYGYPFYQKFGAAAGASTKKAGESFWGMNYFYSRKGWQTNDFLFSSESGKYNSYRSTHLMGIYHSSYNASSWLFGAGYIWERNIRAPEPIELHKSRHDYYLLLRYQGLSAALIGGKDLRWVEGSWNMEQWVWGGRSMPTRAIYFPRFTYTLDLAGDSHRIEYEQNLWNQNFYTRTWMDPLSGEWLATSLDFYFDPTRFFASGFGLVRSGDRILWGYNVRLGLFEVGYTWVDDIMEGRMYKGSWRMGVHLSLGSLLNESFRGRGSNRPEAQEEIRK